MKAVNVFAVSGNFRKHTGGLEDHYLQSGSVHISGQLGSATAGDHKHFVWIYLQKRFPSVKSQCPSCKYLNSRLICSKIDSAELYVKCHDMYVYMSVDTV